MCKSFKNKGLDVKVIVGGGNTLLKKKLDFIGVPTFEIKYLKRNISIFYDLISFVIIIRYLFKFKPDLVSAHSSKAGILSRFACFILNIPVVFTAHGWAFTEGVDERKRQIYKRIEKFLAKLTDKIIAVSMYDYNLAIKENVCDISKMQMIHNGISDPKLKKMTNTSSVINLVMVARFDIPKDQLKLIKSIKDIDNVKLYLIGDGPNFQKSVNYVNDNNLINKVLFLGFIDNVVEVLINMDVFILISDYEGFPISSIEAMSVGLPVIISNVGGASEAVINGTNGLLVENNIENIKKAVEILTYNLELRNNMGEQSIYLYKKNFTEDKMVEDTLRLFQNLIKCH
jgi:glycosyltransferase involved in cell wall biosynthesis